MLDLGAGVEWEAGDEELGSPEVPAFQGTLRLPFKQQLPACPGGGSAPGAGVSACGGWVCPEFCCAAICQVGACHSHPCSAAGQQLPPGCPPRIHPPFAPASTPTAQQRCLPTAA